MNNVIVLAAAATDGALRFAKDGQTKIGQVFVNVPNGRDGYCGMTITSIGDGAEAIAALKTGNTFLIDDGDLRVYGKERGYGFEILTRKIIFLSGTPINGAEMFKAQISGALGRDTDIQFFESGTCKGSNAIAVYAGKDKLPYWVNIEAWGKQAELMQNYCGKGSKVAVAGRIKVETWKDRNSGEDKFKLILVSEKLNPFLSSKNESQPQQAAPTPVAQPTQQPVNPVYTQPSMVAPVQDEFDEIPF